jgi:coproporphyrinogen III oxidase
VSKTISELKEEFSCHVKELQNEISNKLKSLDIKITINEDCWTRLDFKDAPGGGGITRAFEGSLFENAGVNTSEIKGSIDPSFAKNLQGDSDQLWAAGISLIIHPMNPKIPTVHANFRMIQQGEKVWFGGGADLTPYYPMEEDFEYFHNVWKEACAPYGLYDDMKKQCDEYFTNKHRDNEMRGIGGIFFDHLNSGDLGKDFEMVKSLSNNFIKSYFPIVEKRLSESFTEEDEEFMLHRHGRYVEFNLIHDRGTIFGLKTKGRTDSILISLPKRCKFTYQYAPKAGSPHEKMLTYYKAMSW